MGNAAFHLTVYVVSSVIFGSNVYLKAAFFHAATRFEVGANALAGTFLEFWELAATGLNNGLDLLLGLFRDGHHAVQILIHEQSHKHLTQRRGRGERGCRAEK